MNYLNQQQGQNNNIFRLLQDTQSQQNGIPQKNRIGNDNRLKINEQKNENETLPKGKFSAEEIEKNKYGMLGLLSVINSDHYHSTNLQKLFLGFDLTTLGLKLNSSDYIHKTFSSPTTDQHDERKSSVREEYSLPECYKNIEFKDKKEVFIPKFFEESLFYMFYSMPNDKMQIQAARELIKKGWVYHKTLKLWFRKIKILEQRTDYEKGNYHYFDVEKWEKKTKNAFKFETNQRYDEFSLKDFLKNTN